MKILFFKKKAEKEIILFEKGVMRICNRFRNAGIYIEGKTAEDCWPELGAIVKQLGNQDDLIIGGLLGRIKYYCETARESRRFDNRRIQ